MRAVCGAKGALLLGDLQASDQACPEAQTEAQEEDQCPCVVLALAPKGQLPTPVLLAQSGLFQHVQTSELGERCGVCQELPMQDGGIEEAVAGGAPAWVGLEVACRSREYFA